MISYLWLVPVGFLVGAYGTLIGAGGGFVLVPFLLLLYPAENPEVITSISLVDSARLGHCPRARRHAPSPCSLVNARTMATCPQRFRR